LGTWRADPGAVADAVTAAIKVFYSCPKFFWGLFLDASD
jgi:hypothetical protein